jgi:hypothetical protein
MEQSNAPYKALMESVSPDQVQNLVGFLSGYSRDPLATWMGMAQSLKDDGHITNPAFSPDQLQQLIAVQEQQQAGQPGQEDLPPWAQQMQAKLNQYEQQEQQRQAAQAEAQNAQMLEQAHAGMRQTLVAAGIPDDSITPEMMNAYIIAHNGDVATATTAITNFREATLRDFASNGTGPKPPTINGSTPEAPAGALRSKKGDGFRDASLGAAQMLAQGAAQG